MSTVLTDTFEAQLGQWTGYIGRTRRREQFLDTESLRRYAVAVGSPVEVEQTLPPLAHWAWFLEAVPHHRLGPDGHPMRGGDLIPPISLQRRMFAASTLSVTGMLELDQDAQLLETVRDIKHRKGRSGDLVLVELSRELSQRGATRIVEQRTLVYRDGGDPAPAVILKSIPQLPSDVLWEPDTVELFRFSAATFNSHRIHYDVQYAREVEGYPDLIVHGPLVAARLYGFTQTHSTRPLRQFSYRSNAPLFVNQPILLHHNVGADCFEAIRCDGVVAATASASW